MADRAHGADAPPRTEQGDIDARFAYANERTFLAWNRTALALIVTGLALIRFLPPFPGRWEPVALGIPLLVVGGIVAFSSYGHFRECDRAMRCGDSIPSPPYLRVLSLTIGISAILGVLFALFRA